MERRAHPRIPLDLKALVSRQGTGPHRCQIRDFCPGGMYLVPGEVGSPGEPPAPALVAGEEVEIHFSVHRGGAVTGQRQAFRLNARVAHLRGHGFGVSFLHPEPAAVQALTEMTRRPGEPAAEAGGARSALDRQQILGRFRERVGERLPPLVEGFFHRVGESLVAQANWAKSNTEEAAYFDAVTQLRKLRETILAAYGDLILEQIVALTDSAAGGSPGLSGGGPGGLALVDEREFEDWVAMASLITRAEVDHRPLLYEIEQRLADVVGSSVDKENNPVGPAVLCRSFRDALGGVGGTPAVREAIYRVFAEEVLQRIAPLYGELNTLLADAGARLPPPRPQESAAPPAPEPAAPETEPPAPATASTAAPTPALPAQPEPLQKAIYQAFSTAVRERLGEIYDELERVIGTTGGGETRPVQESLNRIFSESMVGLMDDFDGELRQLLTGTAEPTAAPAAGAESPARTAAPPADPYQTARELLRLQRGLGGPAPAPEAPAATDRAYSVAEIRAALDHLSPPGGSNLRDALLAALTRQAAAGAPARQLPPGESDAVETLQAVFDAIRADPVLNEPVKAELERLDQPLLEMALRDDTFLSSGSHPARQVLDQLYRLGIAASEGGTWSDPALGHTLTQMVERISKAPRHDGAVFREVLNPLSELTDQQQQVYTQRVNRVIKECEGRQRTEQAQRATQTALDERLAGREVPVVVLELLDAGWRALLRLTYTREGPESDGWKRYLGTLDRLLTLLGGLDAGGGPPPDLEPLLEEVEHGLGEICFDQYRCNKVQEELRGLLGARESTAAPERVRVPPPSTARSPVERPRFAHRLEQVRRLQTGDWLFLQGEDGERQPLRLIWKGEGEREFVFVDRRGLKAARRTLEELVEDLEMGLATVLGDRDLPLMDRTMQGMIQQMSQQLVFQATHDLLTGLLNRKEFTKRLEQALSNARQEHTQHMLLHLDLDQFRVVNMTAGHGAGDALLQEVAELLEQQLPEESLLGRLGDDEFGILQTHSTPERALHLAESLRQSLVDHHFLLNGQRHPLGASVGLVAVSEQSPTVAELLLNAGSACDSAKAAGGNRSQFHRPDDSELQHRRGVVQWLTRINRALDQDQLVLRCQQIMPLTEGASRHYEILISYQDEDGRLAAPGEFIEAAELYNRMADVDRWVVRKVFRWIVERRQRLEQLGGFAINLSGNSINDPEFLDFLLNELETTGVPADRLCFEITETATIANLGNAAAFMNRIKEHGCRFSLDDFGSGLASYSYLKSLPVDYLKIDGIFIRDILDSPSDYAVVKSINEIAHFMGMKTIAEYAENERIIERLREIGVDYAQGYGVERPLLLAAY